MENELKLGKKVPPGSAIFPEKRRFEGLYTIIEPFQAHKHYQALYPNYMMDPHIWDYMFESPPNSLEHYLKNCERMEAAEGRVLYSVSKKSAPEDWVGELSLMRVEPHHRVVELGSILFSKKLQKTR